MKKMRSLVSLTLVFFLVFSLTAQVLAAEDDTSVNDEKDRQEVQFDLKDLQDAPWAKGYIGKMQSKEVIKGYNDGTFRPNAPVKRIEAIVMAVRLMGLEDEANAKSADVSLHFKDANQIPAWGRGHVAVALEQGLFDATEDKIQPNKPASRIWIVNVLVRALDLEEEALKQMTEIPDFKDSNLIPAGSIGAVNVAIEEGLVTGYGDQTFKPNKSVTRGEMAALLDRTNDGLLEQSGAITVQGTITDISFSTSVTDDVYDTDNSSVTEDVYDTGESSVTDDVYATDGTITISTFNGDSFTYAISSDLVVQDHERLFNADQLAKDDLVTLVVQDNIVLEANLLADEEVNGEFAGILEFKVKAKLGKNQKIELKYKNKKGKTDAKIDMKLGKNKTKLKGEQAISEVEEFLTAISLSSDISEEELLEQVLSALDINQDDATEIEIKVKFANGTEIEIEFENESKEDEKEGYLGINEFKLNVEGLDGTKVNLSFKQQKDKVKAEVIMETESVKETAKGEEAALLMEILLSELELTSEMDTFEAIERILTSLDITEDDIKKLKLKVKFTNDQELEAEIENDSDDDDKKGKGKGKKS